jgi:hypothetical protein
MVGAAGASANCALAAVESATKIPADIAVIFMFIDITP